MPDVTDLISKLRGLTEVVRSAANDTIKEDAEDILDLNKAQMLVLGVDSTGEQIGQYSTLSVELRGEKGLQTDYIDLRDTGDFQNSMELVPTGDSFQFEATDSKWETGEGDAPSLKERWPDALGLTEDNRDRFREMVILGISKKVSNYLGTKQPANVVQRT